MYNWVSMLESRAHSRAGFGITSAVFVRVTWYRGEPQAS